jgi:hypothetical protein
LTSDSSTNATEPVISFMTDVGRELQQYHVALEVLGQYPSVLQDFKEQLARRCKHKQPQGEEL